MSYPEGGENIKKRKRVNSGRWFSFEIYSEHHTDELARAMYSNEPPKVRLG
jgi:hypothetical protein